MANVESPSKLKQTSTISKRDSMNDIYQAKAAIVAGALVTVEKMSATYGTGPFIQMLMQLLQQLLPMLIGCLVPTPKPADLLTAMQNLTFVQRMMIRMHIRQWIGESGGDASVLPFALSRQIDTMCKGCTEADATQLLAM